MASECPRSLLRHWRPLASVSKEPGCEQSPSVRLTSSAAASSKSTGLKSQSTKTSKPLLRVVCEQMEFPMTQSAEVSHAKGYQRQDFVRDCKTHAAGYGASMPELLASFDPNTSSWKTSQLVWAGKPHQAGPQWSPACGEPLRSASGYWPPGPNSVGNIPRMDDGPANRAHRLRALGNAVVPQIPQIIGEAIMRFERELTA
jgi:hypothetical protein